MFTYHPFGFLRACLPLYTVADTHFNIQDDTYVIPKLRQWGRHLAMGEIAVNSVRASGFCLEMYAK